MLDCILLCWITSSFVVISYPRQFRPIVCRRFSKVTILLPSLKQVRHAKDRGTLLLADALTLNSGSGKTAAFLVPILSKLMGKAKKLAAPRPYFVGNADFDPMRDGVRAEPLVLIVAPTRELSTQIFDEARRLCYRSMLRPCVAYGGAPVREQMDELRKGCDILIGTPGRLIDFIERGHLLSMTRVK